MKRTCFSSRRGFTAIELLIVVAIIGILSSTIMVSLNAFRLKAQANQALTDILNISSKLETYKANYGVYPLSCDTGSGGGGVWASKNNHPAGWGCPTGLGDCWIPQFTTEGWCTPLPPPPPPMPYNQNNPPAGISADTSQYIYYTNPAGTEYKLIYHNPVSMAVPEEFIDPARTTNAFGAWSAGCALGC